PPFPVESGYMEKPTVVNNVETLCSVTKIIYHGASWWKEFGTEDSSGTKLLSISGDCKFPGIYEIEWGISIKEILELVGADDVQAIQVGGPSGNCINPSMFNRTLGFNDLATGGSMIVIGNKRDLLRDVVMNFTDFFIEESCGSCVTCRTMTVLLKKKLEKVLNGKGVQQDLDDLIAWKEIMKLSRCGLGQTAMNPITTTIENFPELYKKHLNEGDYFSEFNLEDAVKEHCAATGRDFKAEGGDHE
ncbi:MAG: hypothetical protein K8S56_02230, partial [Candidatus Cloacimonetes bacterium]|nr:hypothetical protein [Candidatus Cloacimonadota bacterium]